MTAGVVLMELSTCRCFLRSSVGGLQNMETWKNWKNRSESFASTRLLLSVSEWTEKF